jgi:ribosomal protein S20
MLLSEETRRKGLIVLKERTDVYKPDQTDVMEFGLKLIFDKIQGHIVDSVLSNIINLENDNQKKILKTVQKTAVLAIQQGYNKIVLALLLSSYVNIDNINEDNMSVVVYEDFKKEFNRILERTRFISDKTLKEGLLCLDDYIDADKLNQRDIMELGLKLTCHGMDALVIDRILSNIINLENNKKRMILKTVQKTAVLAIHAGYDAKTIEMILNIDDAYIRNIMIAPNQKMIPCKGKITGKNGIVYEGDVVNGIPHGKGKVTYADGRTIEGNWKNGKFLEMLEG